MTPAEITESNWNIAARLSFLRNQRRFAALDLTAAAWSSHLRAEFVLSLVSFNANIFCMYFTIFSIMQHVRGFQALRCLINLTGLDLLSSLHLYTEVCTWYCILFYYFNLILFFFVFFSFFSCTLWTNLW